MLPKIDYGLAALVWFLHFRMNLAKSLTVGLADFLQDVFWSLYSCENARQNRYCNLTKNMTASVSFLSCEYAITKPKWQTGFRLC